MASNSPSLPLTSVAAALETLAGGRLHFFDSVAMTSLVAIVLAEQTSPETRDRAEAFVGGVDKTGIVVDDTPGFATSRLAAVQGAEAVRMLEEGVTSARDIDAGMELGYRHPTGPLELGDVTGLDVRLDVLKHLREELGERFKPPALLRRKVRAGKLGRRTGEGFSVWEADEIIGVSVDGGS